MTIHAKLGFAVVVVAVVGVALVLLARFRPHLTPTVHVYVRLCAAAAGLQAVVGIVLLITGERPGQAIHYFYGIATVLPVPLAEAIGKRVPSYSENNLLLVGVGAMALFGLRALTTGTMAS